MTEQREVSKREATATEWFGAGIEGMCTLLGEMLKNGGEIDFAKMSLKEQQDIIFLITTSGLALVAAGIALRAPSLTHAQAGLTAAFKDLNINIKDAYVEEA